MLILSPSIREEQHIGLVVREHICLKMIMSRIQCANKTDFWSKSNSQQLVSASHQTQNIFQTLQIYDQNIQLFTIMSKILDTIFNFTKLKIYSIRIMTHPLYQDEWWTQRKMSSYLNYDILAAFEETSEVGELSRSSHTLILIFTSLFFFEFLIGII